MSPATLILMEKRKAVASLANSLNNLDLNSRSNPKPQIPQTQSSSTSQVCIFISSLISLKHIIFVLTSICMAGRQLERTKSPPSLQSLCLGVVGKHLEDIIPDLAEIAINFPPDVKVFYPYS